MRKILIGCLLLLATVTVAQNQYAWVQKASNPAVGRHRASACASLSRGYFGLGHINNMMGEVVYSDWWEYDPATNTWMQRADFGGGQRYHAVAAGIGNRIFAGTGTGQFSDHDDWWEYLPATNTWVAKATVPGGQRSGAVSATCTGKIYLMLGDFQSDCQEYDPTTNSWTTKATSNVPGYSSVAAVVNNKIYVGVGSGTNWAEYNPATNIWTMKAVFPGVSRFGSGCFTYNGWVYVISGSNWVTEYNDCWAYNPATNQWVQIDDFPGQARHYMVSFTVNGYIYCGSGTSGTNYNDFWQFGTLSGMNDVDVSASLSVYPNPFEEKTTIDLGDKDFDGATLTICDEAGREVKRYTEITGHKIQIAREGLDAGNYFYTITRNNSQPLNGKLVIL